MNQLHEKNIIKDIKKKIKKKIKAHAGTSILEMLCAMLILLLVTSGMTTAVGMATKQYISSMRESQSLVLCSTIKIILENELAYSTQICTDSDGNVERFLSQNYASRGSLSMITTDDSGENGYGQILLNNSAEEKRNLLGKGAYPHGLTAKILTFTYNETTHYFTVKISVGCEGKEYYKEEFQVFNVNWNVSESKE